MQRSFASLSPQEALQVAISIENRNAELYHNFAAMFTEFADQESLQIAATFWEMANEERQHSSLLKQRYAEQYGDAECSMNEQDTIDLIEVPKLESEDLFGAPGDSASGRIRALNVALQAETDAQQFYAKLAVQTSAGPLQDLFHELAHMEDGHVAVLQLRLERDNEGKSRVP